jgi:1-acyl-sn-glycerol-3-phosphate acyltransferase
LASASSITAWSFTASPSIAAANQPGATGKARAASRIAALALLFAVAAPLHVVTRLATGRSRWPKRFLHLAGKIVGLDVRADGPPLAPHSLLIVNHVSWLDILVIGGATGCRFVSKDQLGHGFIHWLADQNATVYVRRTHRKGAKDQANAIAEALDDGRPVALFPEGTTGPGTELLPFRSTLLEAANVASRDIVIRPVALDYGSAAAQIAWFEEPGGENVRRILARRGRLPVTIRLLPQLRSSGDRKTMSADAHQAIARALGFKSGEQSPIGGVE